MKLSFLIISLLFTVNSYAQITVVTPKAKAVAVQKYDSLKSLTNKNIMQHVGQTLFIKGGKHSKENGFYLKFFTEKISSLAYADDHIYKPTERKNSRDIVSSYSELVGKYYKVESIEARYEDGLDSIYWLKLIGDDNIPFYYRITGSSYPRLIFDVVTLGYYEKMKQLFANQDYYFTAGELNKIETNEKITPPAKTRFKCTDMAINMGDNEQVYAVLENSVYGKVKGKIINGKRLESFVSISAYNTFIKKYGATFGSKVALGKTEIGMNQNMVRDVWGAPERINVTEGNFGRHEQWVYSGNQYLYFQNGKLTSKQL